MGYTDHSQPRRAAPAAKPPRLLDQVRDTVRRKHFSLRTEQTYVHWIKRFILYHGKRHPREMGATEVTAFLNHLARERRVASATQNQGLNAILFLYREVLASPLGWLDGIDRAKRPVRVPTVLTQDEAAKLISQIEGTIWLMASLLYGAGLRLMECLRLRVKDVDFGYGQVLVRDGKGGNDRLLVRRDKLPRVERQQFRPFQYAELNRRAASGFNATGRLI